MIFRKTLFATTALIALGAAAPQSSTAPLALGKLAKIGSVDERYQGYNVEMVEVTGGRFWAPYGGPAAEMFRQRPPLDLTDKRLLALARNLGPALMRVSGTWSNNTYLEAEGEHLSAIPAGYRQVLTRQQWRDVVAFSKAADAPIVTSFAVSGGTRGADGVWTTDQAQRIADLTRQEGGSLYAAEFFNEPNLPAAAEGMPKGYGADSYASEFRIFRDWARKAVPQMKIIGPGGANEGSMFKERQTNEPEHPLLMGHIATEDMMARNPGSHDAVSYHFYGSVSQRCAALNKGTAVKADALTPAWLDRTLLDFGFYSALRDKYEPGKPLWNTETAQAACGGSPWASTFLDSFRYLNQNAVLAQKGVQVVLHNTLATSDYALIERDTMTPRPNYWAAVLWRRTMGSTVLASPASASPALRLYAHCSPQKSGGVTVMALNTGAAPLRLNLGGRGMAWTMTGQPVDTRAVRINGKVPSLDPKGELIGLRGAAVAGNVAIPGQAIAFYVVPGANNPACR
jgi:heparanase